MECDTSNDECIFQIDTKPCETAESKIVIPSYDRKRKFKLIDTDKDKTDTDKQPAKRGGPKCWNCGEIGHNTRQCEEPYNPAMVAQNKQQFMKNRGPTSFNGLTRYYQDTDQSFDDIKPGNISTSLRRALGLSGGELPKHIYNMRLFGYPPGWLEEAKVIHSGLSLFDSKGNAVAEPDDEEGEVVDFDERSKYDINKLVKYPGYNVSPPKGTVDDWEKMQVPPMLESHSLENMIEVLMPNAAKAYRRNKLLLPPSSSPPPGSAEMAKDTSADMEFEETPDVVLLPEDGCKFIPSLPESEPPKVEIPPPPPPEDGPDSVLGNDEQKDDTSDSNAQRGTSPTLSELQEQKASVIAELNDTNSNTNLSEVSSTSTKTPVSSRIKVTTVKTPADLGQTKEVHVGTPILKSFSPYSKLPKQEAWSQNICDVINFENLPDYTGIYEKMVKVIDKVRVTVKKIQQDE